MSISASLSGLQSAQRAMDMVSHNIANSETPQYHKIEAIFKELGPFPVVSGVTVDARRVENNMVDNAMQSAAINKQSADTFADAVDKLNALPFSTLEQSYSDMMDSTHTLMRIPLDPVAQENFNQMTQKFQNSVNRYDDQLQSIKQDIQLKMGYENDKVQRLQDQLAQLSKTGTGSSEDINFIKMQLLQATGSIDAYRKVLSNIIPPVELAFRSAVDIVYGNMNDLSGQTIFNDGTVSRITHFHTFNNEPLTEWDSQWFNTEMGRIQTLMGGTQQIAENDQAIANNAYDAASKDFQDTFGVDLVEETVKMKQYQRMYEANAMAIKTQDEMMGTLLSIKA